MDLQQRSMALVHSVLEMQEEYTSRDLPVKQENILNIVDVS